MGGKALIAIAHLLRSRDCSSFTYVHRSRAPPFWAPLVLLRPGGGHKEGGGPSHLGPVSVATPVVRLGHEAFGAS